jgi:hypothetical protein
MAKSRFLVILTIVLICLLVMACKTTGTPKQSDGTATKPQVAAGPKASPSQTVSRSAGVKSVTKAQRKELASKPGKPSKPAALSAFRSLLPFGAPKGQAITTMRAIIYAALATILLVIIGATTAARVSRHRRLATSSARS